MISEIISILFKILYLIIIVVVLLSWVPIFDTKKEPLATLIKIYNSIIAPFRAIIPPIGMFDISPVVAIIVIQIVGDLLLKILGRFGL